MKNEPWIFLLMIIGISVWAHKWKQIMGL